MIRKKENKMQIKILSLLFTIGLFSQSLFANPLQSIDRLDIKSYLGLWHEYLRLPNEFEDKENKFCFDVTAEYKIISEKSLSVTNTCHFLDKNKQIQTDIANGRAVIENSDTNASLKVEFIPIPVLRDIVRWISEPNYIVIGLGEKNQAGLYSWAVVGSPDRKYAWVLSRKVKLSPEDDTATRKILESQGFQVSKLIRPIQKTN